MNLSASLTTLQFVDIYDIVEVDWGGIQMHPKPTSTLCLCVGTLEVGLGAIGVGGCRYMCIHESHVTSGGPY